MCIVGFLCFRYIMCFIYKFCFNVDLSGLLLNKCVIKWNIGRNDVCGFFFFNL